MTASDNQIVVYQPNEPVWVDMKGWSRSSLMYMRQFTEAWTRREIVQAPLGQLPWYHHLASLKNTVRLTFAARMLAHPSGSAFAESSLRNAFAFLRRIYRFRSRGTRDPTRRVTVAAWPHKTVSLFCRWFLSRFSSAV